MDDTISYEFERLDTRVGNKLSLFGERRWLLTTKSPITDKLIGILNKLGWVAKGQFYISPKPYKAGDESNQILLLFSELHNDDKQGIEILCVVGSIALE